MTVSIAKCRANTAPAKESESMRVSRMYGKRLQAVREGQNMKLGDVIKANPTLRRSHLTEWETGKKPIPVWAIAALCKVYGVSADYILGLEAQEKDIRVELEWNEAVRRISSGFFEDMTIKLNHALGAQALAMHCYEDLQICATELCQQVDRMINFNPDWFESEVRNGARVLSLLGQTQASIEKARLAGRQNRLVNMLPTAVVQDKNGAQTALNLCHEDGNY